MKERLEEARRIYKLTEQQAKFLEAYLETGSLKRAAEAAGYAQSDRSGWRVLHTERVQKALAYVTGARKEDTVSFWLSVMKDPSVSIMARLKASELLAKALGMFVIRQEISGPDNADIKVTVHFVDNPVEA